MSNQRAREQAMFLGYLLFPLTTPFALAWLVCRAISSLNRDAQDVRAEWQAFRLESDHKEQWAERGLTTAIADQWRVPKAVDPYWDGDKIVYRVKNRKA